jgi:hemoglobin-like flavoprotein
MFERTTRDHSSGDNFMDISDSVTEILKSEDLIGGQFYDRFFTECPHLKEHFNGVDMKRQSALLTSALVLVETIHSKEAVGLSPYLKMLGKDHQERGIEVADYGEWTESMIRTLSEFHGSQWNERLEQEWRQAIADAVQIMLDAYQD